MDQSTRSDVETVRSAALHLHKVLIDTVRLEHEREYGRIGSPAELLQLVAFDPRFAWLRPLSRQIVALDDQLSGEWLDPAFARVQVEDTLSDEGFEEPYLDCLQSAPNAVLAHAALLRALQALPPAAAMYAAPAEA
ncbi:MAG TPA: hypothetical protein VJR89_14805 [Polyangiales bacterium]|nr:hypothetical protein [Polyangiales bacterium]